MCILPGWLPFCAVRCLEKSEAIRRAIVEHKRCVKLQSPLGRPSSQTRSRAPTYLALYSSGANARRTLPPHAAVASVARVHKHHAPSDDGTRAIKRAVLAADSVRGLVVTRCVEVCPSSALKARCPSTDPECTTPGIAVTAWDCAGLHTGFGTHGCGAAYHTLSPFDVRRAVSPPPCLGSSGNPKGMIVPGGAFLARS
jgi:hypothetical protein